MTEIKVIFWDFDGVLINSNHIRDKGFLYVLADFPQEQVKQLLNFHKENGGLSRYIKFRYFFEEIRKELVTESSILHYAEKFSSIMREQLINPSLLITDSLDFIIKNQEKYTMHITSGSDQEELRYLCKSLKIDHLFTTICGSPKPKKEILNELITTYKYTHNSCILIGDSLNDWEAAKENSIKFMAYNNFSLATYSDIVLF